jgi:hypothetical protein
MQRAVNITIEEEVFSMWFAYIHYGATDVFPTGPPRDYVSGTEPNEVSQPVWRRGRIPPP